MSITFWEELVLPTDYNVLSVYYPGGFSDEVLSDNDSFSYFLVEDLKFILFVKELNVLSMRRKKFDHVLRNMEWRTYEVQFRTVSMILYNNVL